MSFLSPMAALIAAALAVPALVALYFLKLRRRQVSVPSTLLWRKAIEDMQVNAPFQRLRRNLLLLLQLLLLAALLLAMARPTLWTTAAPGQRVVIVIDHSASMNARADGGQTRLQAAKDAAHRMIDNLSADDEAGGGAMIVSFADRPQVAANFTSDPAKLHNAIDRIAPTDQLSRLGPALRVVEPHAEEAAAQGGPKLRVQVLSDGRVHEPDEGLGSLDGAELNYLQVGAQRQNNLAVTAFSARRSFETPERVQVFARLANYTSDPIDTNLTLRVDGRTSEVQQITVPAGETTTGPAGPALPENDQSQDEGSAVPQASGQEEPVFQPGTQSVQFSFALPGTGMIWLNHDHDDALAADDRVQLALAPARRLRVLLVTEGNAFLRRVIESVGVRQVVRMSPAEYRNQDPQQLRRRNWDDSGAGGPGSGFDVIVFDQFSPDQLPPVSTLSFGATPPVENLARREPGEEAPGGQVILDWQRQHPMMRYVTLSEVVLSDAGWLAVPTDGTVLATGRRGPVMAQVSAGGRAHVVASFPVLQSNWPMQVSFPVFVANALQTLGLGGLLDEAGVSYRPGEVAAVPVAEAAEQISYSGPETLTAEVADGEAVLPAFKRVGIYETEAEVEPPHGRLAVNLLDAVESDLRPAEALEVAAESISSSGDAQSVQRPIWPWFVWAALGLLLLEWALYTWRMRV